MITYTLFTIYFETVLQEFLSYLDYHAYLKHNRIHMAHIYPTLLPYSAGTAPCSNFRYSSLRRLPRLPSPAQAASNSIG